MVNVRSKEWQQIFQQALRMVILTQGLLITQLQALGNQVLQQVEAFCYNSCKSCSISCKSKRWDLAYAEDTDALYLRKASTWERVYTGTDEVLSFDNDPAATIVLLQDGTATTVNLPATDPEGFPITYSHDTNPSNQAQATITNSGSTYTITPLQLLRTQETLH